MFRIKICGVTNREDALAAANAGADAIGLNFYDRSQRFCGPEQAKEIAAALPPAVCKVGVFVNAAAAEVRDAARSLALNLVQIHGDEPPEFLAQLRGLAVMRAFRVQSDLAPVADYLARCYTLACVPRMVLLDAGGQGKYGGTGTTFDWQLLIAGRPQLAGAPLVLSGGLNPDNVAGAIGAVQPWAVDVASGVEDAPGKKSVDLVRRFVSESLGAFAAIGAAS